MSVMITRFVKNSLLIGFIYLIFAATFGCNNAAELSDDAGRDEPPQTYAPEVIAALDADYYIDYENGTTPIGDLPIGSKVVDPSWEWEHKLGINYSDIDQEGNPTPPGEVKPIIWIIVAKDHYDLNESHVTLLSEELIGRFFFDYRTDTDHEYSPLGGHWGSSHWGDSGANVNSINGLRPWLNSTGINTKEGFFDQISVKFMEAVLITPVPNREWKEGKAYTTHDKVFIPSITELGDKVHFYTYQIGTAYPYFADVGNAKRVASLGGKKSSYWTRTPESDPNGLRTVHYTGGFVDGHDAHFGGGAVRPALNLKAGILVSEIRD